MDASTQGSRTGELEALSADRRPAHCDEAVADDDAPTLPFPEAAPAADPGDVSGVSHLSALGCAFEWYMAAFLLSLGVAALCIAAYQVGISERAIAQLALGAAIIFLHPYFIASLLADLLTGLPETFADHDPDPEWLVVFCLLLAPYIAGLFFVGGRRLLRGGLSPRGLMPVNIAALYIVTVEFRCLAKLTVSSSGMLWWIERPS